MTNVWRKLIHCSIYIMSSTSLYNTQSQLTFLQLFPLGNYSHFSWKKKISAFRLERSFYDIRIITVYWFYSKWAKKDRVSGMKNYFTLPFFLRQWLQATRPNETSSKEREIKNDDRDFGYKWVKQITRPLAKS